MATKKQCDLLALAAAAGFPTSWTISSFEDEKMTPFLAAPGQQAPLKEVQALVRRWQKSKDADGWILRKPVRKRPVPLKEIKAVDASRNYPEYRAASGRKGPPAVDLQVIVLPDGGYLEVTSDGRE